MMNNLHYNSGASQELSMYKCTALDCLMPIVSEHVLMPSESSKDLVQKSFALQETVCDYIYQFLLELYKMNGQNLDRVKIHFTTQPVAHMTRAKLQNLGISEFFNICRDKIEWYKCEAYLDPIIQREKNTEKLEQILEDIKANIRAYLKDRVVYVHNQAIFRVDDQYDQYSAIEWPYIQRIVINCLGPETRNMRFSIIKTELFGDPTQASDSYHGSMVTPPTKPWPRSSSKEDVMRQGGITIS